MENEEDHIQINKTNDFNQVEISEILQNQIKDNPNQNSQFENINPVKEQQNFENIKDNEIMDIINYEISNNLNIKDTNSIIIEDEDQSNIELERNKVNIENELKEKKINIKKLNYILIMMKQE